MEFEFDPSKSNLNQNKHGINFVEAQQIWFDVNRVKVPARTEDELRFIIIGKIKDKHWSAVITYRDSDIPTTNHFCDVVGASQRLGRTNVN